MRIIVKFIVTNFLHKLREINVLVLGSTIIRFHEIFSSESKFLVFSHCAVETDLILKQAMMPDCAPFTIYLMPFGVNLFAPKRGFSATSLHFYDDFLT